MDLIFNNKTIHINNNCGCLFLKVLLDCDENKNVKIDKTSDFFENYILKKNLYFVNLKDYTNEQIEELFHEFGYYGATEQIHRLRVITKRIIKYKRENIEQVENFLEKHIINNIELRMKYEHSLFTNPNLFTIEKYINENNFNAFIYNMSLTEDVIEDFLDTLKSMGKFDNNLSWLGISINPNLSEKFHRKYIDKVNWWHFNYNNKNISENFYDDNSEKVSWTKISTNCKLSKEFIEKYKDKLDLDKLKIHYFENTFETSRDGFNLEEVDEKLSVNTSWNKIINQYKVPINYIVKNKENINLSELCAQKFDAKIYSNYKDHYLSKYL
jgi:hypothetical protein